jgi:hypothetical protein
MTERNIKNEIYEAYLVLQDMHDIIIDFKYFDEDLINRGLNAIDKLTDWKIKDPKLKTIVFKTVELLKMQLKCSEKIREKKEEVWNDYRIDALATGSK